MLNEEEQKVEKQELTSKGSPSAKNSCEETFNKFLEENDDRGDDSGFGEEFNLEQELQKRRSIRIVQIESKKESEKPLVANPSTCTNKKLDEKIFQDEELLMVSIVEHKKTFQMMVSPSILFPADLNVGQSCIVCHKNIKVKSIIMNVCNICVKAYNEILCFVCHQPSPSLRCDPALECSHCYHRECLKFWPQIGETGCPQHKCHTCFNKDCSRDGNLMKCVECPAAYHATIFCLPAGSKVKTTTQILCPRHQKNPKVVPLNIDWCIICGEYGSLICCETCCYSYHQSCIKYEPSDKVFKCQSCIMGRLPLNLTIVWAKQGTTRWWPSLILPDASLSPTILKAKKYDNELCVKFFGTYRYLWTTCDRVFPYNGSVLSSSRRGRALLEEPYKMALDEASKLHKYLNFLYKITQPIKQNPYEEITENIPVPPVTIKRYSDEADDCHCDISDPCGPSSGCLNRQTYFECTVTCAMGKHCQNQRIRNKDYSKVKVVQTLTAGFGLITNENLYAGTFVIEYVGEIINAAEMNRRMKELTEKGETNFYFLIVSSDLYIDCYNFGNMSRFINHSCDPNCVTQKIFVDGVHRMGIYTRTDIRAGTELTFDYKMEMHGGKIECFCGSSKCSGFLSGA